MFSLDLAVNAVVAGLLLGGFYAAVTIGVTISFGMLHIVNIAHLAFRSPGPPWRARRRAEDSPGALFDHSVREREQGWRDLRSAIAIE